MMRSVGLSVLFLCALNAAVVSTTSSDVTSYDMPLYIVPDTIVKSTGAACLDGSSPGFYFEAASNPANADKWVLYAKGGGWCYDEASCAQRALGELGSQAHFPKTFGFGEGPVSGDPSLNPTFASWNRVIMWYCDGNSFSGAKMTTTPGTLPNGTVIPLHFRGHANLKAILATLIANHGMNHATEVLLSGGSAGGLTTFIHADGVAAMLPSSVTKYGAVPVSGYFMDHLDVDGVREYANEMQYVFNMQNASSGVNQACLSAQPAGMEWRCNMAQWSLAHTTSRVFALQSVLDAWQMGNVVAPRDNTTTPWSDCVKNNFANCNQTMIEWLNNFARDMVTDITTSSPRSIASPGNGAFLYTCDTHVAAQGSGWTKYVLDGVVMHDAVDKWWNSEPSSAAQIYKPCSLTNTSPHQCNPSCL